MNAMEPIVSPWIFYWVDVIYGLKGFLCFTMMAFVFFIIRCEQLVRFGDSFARFGEKVDQ